MKRATRRALLILGIGCAAALLPFVDKPLHIDDPLFVELARRIGYNPLESTREPFPYQGQRLEDYLVYEASHPPLVPYILKLSGGGEYRPHTWPWHLALFPFSLAAMIGFFFVRGVPTGATVAGRCWPR